MPHCTPLQIPLYPGTGHTGNVLRVVQLWPCDNLHAFRVFVGKQHTVCKWKDAISGFTVSQGWMDQDATWYWDRPRPRPHCVRWGPSSTTERGTAAPITFRPMSIVSKQSPISATAGLLSVYPSPNLQWMFSWLAYCQRSHVLSCYAIFDRRWMNIINVLSLTREQGWKRGYDTQLSVDYFHVISSSQAALLYRKPHDTLLSSLADHSHYISTTASLSTTLYNRYVCISCY